MIYIQESCQRKLYSRDVRCERILPEQELNVKMLLSMYSLYSCAVTRMLWAPRNLVADPNRAQYPSDEFQYCMYIAITNYYCRPVGEYKQNIVGEYTDYIVREYR
jgi:hypothetical protein